MFFFFHFYYRQWLKLMMNISENGHRNPSRSFSFSSCFVSVIFVHFFIFHFWVNSIFPPNSTVGLAPFVTGVGQWEGSSEWCGNTARWSYCCAIRNITRYKRFSTSTQNIRSNLLKMLTGNTKFKWKWHQCTIDALKKKKKHMRLLKEDIISARKRKKGIWYIFFNRQSIDSKTNDFFFFFNISIYIFI